MQERGAIMNQLSVAVGTACDEFAGKSRSVLVKLAA